MEHVPLPRKPRFRSIDFPYLGTTTYDGGDFFGYPSRRGFDVDEAAAGFKCSIPIRNEKDEETPENTTFINYRSYQLVLVDDEQEKLSPQEKNQRGGETKEVSVTQSDEFISFYHAWFYFGMLHAFLSPLIDLDQESFLRKRDGGVQLLCTEPLEAALGAWYAQLKLSFGPAGMEEQMFENIKTRLVVLEYVQEGLIELESHFDMQGDPDGNVSLSIRLLGEALMRTLVFAFEMFRRDLEEREVTLVGCVCPQEFHDEMRRRIYRWVKPGDFSEECVAALWCPSEIEKFSWATPSVRCYMAALERPEKLGKDHDKCSEARCLADNIDETTYEPSHVEESCTCEYIGPTEESLHDVLDRGQIPTAILTVDKDDNVTSVKIGDTTTAQQAGVGFVATSHVWSDGRGNSKSNTLPACQLVAIAKMCKRILPKQRDSEDHHVDKKARPSEFSLNIWIDTLCIPRNNLKYRSSAIERIDDVFKEATVVLVLDASMLAYPYASPEETMARLALSGWNRRAWTLQEAINGGDEKIMIALDGGNAIYPCYQNRGRLYHKHYNPEHDGVIYHGLYTFGCAEENKRDHNTLSLLIREYQSAIEALTLQGDHSTALPPSGMTSFAPLAPSDEISSTFISGPDLLNEIWAELSHRSTTKNEDYVIVIASMLGLPIKPISQERYLPGRLKELYSMFHELPIEAIFGTGSRLEAEGWRWAPGSVESGSWGPSEVEEYRPARVTPNGLTFVCDGLLLPETECPSSPIFPFKVTGNYDQNVQSEGNPISTYMSLIYVQEDSSGDMLSNEAWAKFCSRMAKEGYTRLAIIIHNNTGSSLTTPLSQPQSGANENTSLALVVGVVDYSMGDIRCIRGHRARLINVTNEQVDSAREHGRDRILLNLSQFQTQRPGGISEATYVPITIRDAEKIKRVDPHAEDDGPGALATGGEVQTGEPNRDIKDDLEPVPVQKVTQQLWCLG